MAVGPMRSSRVSEKRQDLLGLHRAYGRIAAPALAPVARRDRWRGQQHHVGSRLTIDSELDGDRRGERDVVEDVRGRRSAIASLIVAPADRVQRLVPDHVEDLQRRTLRLALVQRRDASLHLDSGGVRGPGRAGELPSWRTDFRDVGQALARMKYTGSLILRRLSTTSRLVRSSQTTTTSGRNATSFS